MRETYNPSEFGPIKTLSDHVVMNSKPENLPQDFLFCQKGGVLKRKKAPNHFKIFVSRHKGGMTLNFCYWSCDCGPKPTA